MRKRIVLIVVLGILFMACGCSSYLSESISQKDIDIQKDTAADVNETPDLDNEKDASIGGVYLGDSAEEVVNILGNDYEESTEVDNAGVIGEDTVLWTFDKGITVCFGKESGEVIRVISNSSDFPTNLEVKVGDEAETVFEKYKTFKEATSRHSDDVLTGWFHVEDEEIIIFDFDKEDNIRTNNEVAPDSTVQEIVLGYWKHFD